MGTDAIGRQPDEPDRGLATERTALAWTRSALALAAIGALAVRRGAQGDLPAVAYPVGALLFGAAVALWMLGASIYNRRVARTDAGDPAPRAVAFKIMSIGTVGIAVAAIVLAIPV
ncbi:MAG TPA: DUF202 domain-containing protein [Acidimicrobiales bacterium]